MTAKSIQPREIHLLEPAISGARHALELSLSGPRHPDNVALRDAMRFGDPLIWFRGLGKGLYLPVFPVWIVAEEPRDEQVAVELDEACIAGWLSDRPRSSAPETLDRARTLPPTSSKYRELLVTQRVARLAFRARVLKAYRCACAVCRLRHAVLLEAARLSDDLRSQDSPVSYGIAMCTLHHAAFQERLLGITPSCRIEVRPDILEEEDSPMVGYALQRLNGASISVPEAKRDRPDRHLLEEAYAAFKEAS